MSRPIKAGHAFIELGIKSQIEKGLQAASDKMKSAGGNIARLGAVLSGTAIAMLTAPVALASEMAETVAKFSTVFGSRAGRMEAWATQTARVVGTSKQQMMDMAASMQDLLVPMGVVPDAAADATKQLSTLAVDLASFNNMDTAAAFSDLQAAITGSGEVMKKYGVVLSAAVVNQALINSGIDPRNATEAEKAMARMAVIMRGTSSAQGDSVRTGGSFANQIKRLSATIKDIGAAMGAGVLDTLASFLRLVNKGASTLRTFMEGNQRLSKLLGMAVLGIGALGGAMVFVGGAITAAGFALGTIATVLGFIMSPVGLVIGGIIALGVAIFRYTDWASKAIDAAGQRFGGLVNTVGKTFGNVAAAVGRGDAETALSLATDAVELVWIDMTKGIRTAWQSVTDWLTDLATHVAGAIAELFHALLESLSRAVDAYARYYNVAYNFFVDAFGRATGVRTIGGPVDAFGRTFGDLDSRLRAATAAAGEYHETLNESAREESEATERARQAADDARMKRRDALMGRLNAAGASPVVNAPPTRPELDPTQALAMSMGGGVQGGSVASAVSTAGTFSGFAAALLGGRITPDEQIANNFKRMVTQRQQLIAEAKKPKPALVGR